jgi:hypothetical protein
LGKILNIFTNNIIISVEATKVLGIHTQIKRNTLSNLLQKLASKNTKIKIKIKTPFYGPCPPLRNYK